MAEDLIEQPELPIEMPEGKKPFAEFWEEKGFKVTSGAIVLTLVIGIILTLIGVSPPVSIGGSLWLATVELFLGWGAKIGVGFSKRLNEIKSDLGQLNAGMQQLDAGAFDPGTDQNVESISQRYDGYSKIRVFYGIKSLSLLTALIARRKQVGYATEAYLAPSCVGRFYPESLSDAPVTLFLADIPEHSVEIFSYEKDRCVRCEIFHPYVDKEDTFYSLSISPRDKLWNARLATFEFYRHVSTPLTDKYIGTVASEMAKRNKEQLKYIYRNRSLTTSSEYYYHRYLTELMQLAEISMHAIDFLPPEDWLELPYRIEYLRAQRNSAAEKERVHVYERAYAYENQDTYRRFTEAMEKSGVTLWFIEKATFERSFPAKGGVIMDEKCVVILNQKSGKGLYQEVGHFSFDPHIVATFRTLFGRLKDNAQTREDFERSIRLR